MKCICYLMLAVLWMPLVSVADSRPNLLFILLDDLGYGHCAFHNDELSVEAFSPYFKELVEQRQDYEPEKALEFSRRAMPTLSRLANEGTIFTRAYTASSLCAPSRLAIATGLNLQEAGIYCNVDVEVEGLKPGTHLAHILQDAGYGTAHIGKWHIAERDYQIIRAALDRHKIEEDLDFYVLRDRHPEIYNEVWEAGYYGSVKPAQNPLKNGFDYYFGYNSWASQFYDSPLVWENYEHAGRQAGYNTDVFTDKALTFMQHQLEKEKPFYVQLHYHAVHDYLQPNAPDRYWNGLRSTSYELSNFYAHINAVDQNIQRILNYLKEHDELSNTVIVFTSDNGAMSGGPSVLPGNAPFSGHKGTLRQGGTRVPLLFYWPRGVQDGKKIDHLVSAMDILPTLIDIAGLTAPENLEAKSLTDLLTGDDTPVHDHLIWAGIDSRAWGYTINKSFKTRYAERMAAPGGWAIAQGDYLLRFTGTVVPELYHETPEGAPPRLALYNVKTDPAETTDIAADMPEQVEAMITTYMETASNFKPPVWWKRDRWEELVKPPVKYR